MSFYDEEIDLEILKPYFKRRELAANDGSFKLAPMFAEQLMRLRIAYGRPMTITSGCRTRADLARLVQRGYSPSPNSFHLIDNPKWKTGGCCAIDVAWPIGDRAAYELVREAMKLDWNVRIAPMNFIHLDRRKDYTPLRSELDFYR